MSISFPKIFSFFMLFLICTLMWLIQSLPTINLFFVGNGGESTMRKSIFLEEARLPSIVICNRLPYTQAGLSAFGKGMNQDTLRVYLQEWFDPSIVDSPDFEDMSDEERKFAETTIAQLLPNTGLKQRLEQILLKCQDFLSSCVIQGVSMSGFHCCENVQPFLATFGGICWIFANRTFVQESMDNRFGIQITFQIAKNSFLASLQGVHPGLSVYLVSDDDRISIATKIPSQAFNLKDKRQKIVLVRKQIETTRNRKDCENAISRDLSVGSYERFSNNTSTPLASNFAACLMEAAVQQCSCVPLIAVLWTLQGDFDVSFLRRFDVSSICTADEYNRCARKFVMQSHPDRWNANIRSVANHKNLRESVEYCRSKSRMPCQRTTFETLQMDESELPQEYKSTQDFVSRFVVAYDSLQVTEIIHERDLHLRQFLIILGYNLATWFAIGYLTWLMLGWFCRVTYTQPSHKIGPRQSMVISSPIQIRPRGQHLPPLEIAHNPHKSSTLPDTKNVQDGNRKSLPRVAENLPKNDD